MSITSFLIVANFFVKFHIVEGNVHTYTMSAVYNGQSFNVVHSGEKLPIDDDKKFFARIKAECIEVADPNWICEAKSISYE